VQGLGEGSDPGRDRLGHGHKIYGARDGVDNGGVGDADLGSDLGASAHVGLGHGHGNPADEAVVPVGHPGAVGVEGVGAVVFGDDIDHIVGAPADGNVGHVQGLGVNLPVHRVGEKFPEIGTVDVCGREDGFALVPAVASLVVMVSGQGCLGVKDGSRSQDQDQARQKR